MRVKLESGPISCSEEEEDVWRAAPMDTKELSVQMTETTGGWEVSESKLCV